MKIHHLSDSHNFHEQLVIPEGIDTIVHTGDATNFREPFFNEKELDGFIDRYSKIECPNKIYVPGNHDSYIFEIGRKNAKKLFADNGIIYLEQESITFDGIKFYGEPHSPKFGNWFFMRDRAKMHKLWEGVPEDTNVLLTHGPAYGIMDATENRDGSIELVGDKSLRNHINSGKWKDLKLVCHGHVHSKGLINPPMVVKYNNILISNAAAVEDGRFDKGIVHHGNTINI